MMRVLPAAFLEGIQMDLSIQVATNPIVLTPERNVFFGT
jgi:hypothetical protein